LLAREGIGGRRRQQRVSVPLTFRSVGRCKSAPRNTDDRGVRACDLTHIVEESLKLIAHVDWTFVPFSGDARAVTTLLGGHVTAIVATYSAVMEQVASRKLGVLAVTGREREAALPDVPTIAEYGRGTGDSGYKDFDVTGWLGVLAPAHTPSDLIANLSGQFVSALAMPEVKSKLLA
jgi:tripartite-type tricarboxylate transporter receptor subunit TctC